MNQVVISGRCPQCGHPSKPHVFDSNGKPRCPECPQEMCGAHKENVPAMLDFGELTTIGIKPINEMTERELVEEIMHAQFIALGRLSMETKRSYVAQIRVSSAKARIYREANVEPPDPYAGIFGDRGWAGF